MALLLSTQGFLLKISFTPLFLRSWGQHGCQKKRKTSRNSNLLVWSATFHPKLNKPRKTSKNGQKAWKNDCFLVVFQSLFNFGWKVADKTNKFEFLEVFCFFWYPCCPQERGNSGDITVFIFFIDIFWWWRHLAIFFIIFKMKPNVTFIGLSVIGRVFRPFWTQNCKNC